MPLRLEFSFLTRLTTSLISNTAGGTHVSHLAMHVAATLQGPLKHHGHARKCPGMAIAGAKKRDEEDGACNLEPTHTAAD